MHLRRWLPLTVMIYMVLAIGWWTVLLHRTIKHAYTLERSQLDSQDPSFQSHFDLLTSEYNRELFMVFGEGVVFILILGIGLYLINRAYYRELETVYQKRNFLMAITHELKSPLSGIKLALETIRKHKLKPEQQSELIEAALDENHRLHNLVDNILLAAKVEKDYQLNKETIHLNSIIEELLDGYHIKFPKFEFDFSPGAINQIEFDRVGIYSILNNLIENGIKYSGENRRISIATNQEKNIVELIVADHGIGIIPEEREKIFGQFYRIGSEATRKTKGTGLGLYIVKKIIEAHKGAIQIISNSPTGSIFKVKIPVNLST